ncbi:MAG: hypothetical protein TYPL_2240 [Candidatus Tyloplasma litorale]|nr:MAG: hypothetical protein TYPL_2240 [Mycoplasmatales bacterium]
MVEKPKPKKENNKTPKKTTTKKPQSKSNSNINSSSNVNKTNIKPEGKIVEKKLYLYKPNFLLKLGVTFNIIFASLFSLLILTLPITIVAITLNAMILVPRVNTKRYWATWRIIPILLSFLLAFLVLVGAWFSWSFVSGMVDSFFDFLSMLSFWKKEPINVAAFDKMSETIQTVIGTGFIFIASIGNVLILFGWYKGKEIAIVKTREKEEIKSERWYRKILGDKKIDTLDEIDDEDIKYVK